MSIYEELQQANLISQCLETKEELEEIKPSSHKKIRFKCLKCSCVFEREARSIHRALIAELGEKSVYCNRCSKHLLRSEKEDDTLYNWLQTQGKESCIRLSTSEDIEHPEEETQKYILSLEEAKHTSIHTQDKTYFTCTIHNKSYLKEIRSVCAIENKHYKYRLECCRKTNFDFTLQDWCFLLYYFPIDIIKVKKSKYGVQYNSIKYTGSMVREYYNKASNKNTIDNINFNMQDKAFFQCSICDFYAYLHRVTGGRHWRQHTDNTKNQFKSGEREWCNPNEFKCKKCNEIVDNLLAGRPKARNVADFLKTYRVGSKDEIEIIGIEEELEKKKKALCSIDAEIAKTEKMMSLHKKSNNLNALEKSQEIKSSEQAKKIEIESDIEERKAYYNYLRDLLFRETCKMQRQYTSSIIKLLTK